MSYGNVPIVTGVFYGIKPAVTALVLHAAHHVGTRALRNAWMWAIAAAAFIAIFAFETPFPAIVAVAGLMGWFGSRALPSTLELGGGHGGAKAGHDPALIDDDTPTPAHALFTRTRLWRVLAIGGRLCCAAMARWWSRRAGKARRRRWPGSSQWPRS